MTSSANRASIERHGLDWRRMGSTHGIASVAGLGRGPEVEGIFLARDEWEVEWFAEMAISSGHVSVDVWDVSLPTDAKLLDGYGGYPYLPEPIPREAIRLLRTDWTPESRFGE